MIELDFKEKTRRYSGGLKSFLSDWMILILFVALVTICMITMSKFRDPKNLFNIIRQASFIAIIAMGEFFVILTGNMDMSISAIIGLVSIFFAGFVVTMGAPVWLALIVVILMSVIVGIINGLLTIIVNAIFYIPCCYEYFKGFNFICQADSISGLPQGFNFFGSVMSV